MRFVVYRGSGVDRAYTAVAWPVTYGSRGGEGARDHELGGEPQGFMSLPSNEVRSIYSHLIQEVDTLKS